MDRLAFCRTSKKTTSEHFLENLASEDFAELDRCGGLCREIVGESETADDELPVTNGLTVVVAHATRNFHCKDAK